MAKTKEQIEEEATKAFEDIDKMLDKVENDLIKGMVQFGASSYDAEEMRPWLRHTIREQMFRLLMEKLSKTK